MAFSALTRVGRAGRLALFLAVLGIVGVGSTTSAHAQRMDLALSRLTYPSAPGDSYCDNTSGTGAVMACADDGQWRQLITEFTGALIPPMLTPARTRGPRSFYIGLDTSITGISASRDFWHRGTEGQTPGADENRQVDGALAWTRITVRKAFPFGFELGTNIGYLVNTSYWALGAEIRWSILEGWLSHDWVVPDIAFRGAVQTLVGDQEFNATVAVADVSISNSIVIGDSFELTPITGGQVAWTWADSELVDLTPGTNAFSLCNPGTATPSAPGDPTCGSGPGNVSGMTYNGSDYNNNAVFASIRTLRPRAFVGVQARYEAFTLIGMFSGDLIPPTDIGSNHLTDVHGDPLRIDRQWRIDLGVGLSY